MSDSSLSDLSYRQLQTLAVACKLPGNTNREGLIQFIKCSRAGDEERLKDLLEEHKRKKEKRRLEKRNENQLSNRVTSTPSRSPSYCDDKDRYSPPLQAYKTWATSQKNLSNYHEDELQKFLLERMHHYKARDYYNTPQHQRKRKHYDLETNENESEKSSIIDLRISSDKKISSKKSSIDLLNLEKKLELPKKLKKNFLFSGGDVLKNHEALKLSENVRTMLLKKMLQAPAGANLNNLTNIDDFYRFIIANKNLTDKNFYPTPSSDSDTLTADSSESTAGEYSQFHQNYYSLEKNPNPLNIPDIPLLDINQGNLIKNKYNNATNYAIEDTNLGYNYNHPEPQDWNNLYQNDVQENCKKWLTNSMDMTNEMNPLSSMANNKNLNMIYNSMYSPQQNNNIPDTNCYSTLVHQDSQQEYPQNLQAINNQERLHVVRTPGGYCGGVDYLPQNYQENNNNNLLLGNGLNNCIIPDKIDEKDRRFYQCNQEVWTGGNGQGDVGAGGGGEQQYIRNVAVAAAAPDIWTTTGGQRVNEYNFHGNGYDNDCYNGNNQVGYYQSPDQTFGGNNFEESFNGQQQGLMESTGSSENTLNSIDSSSFSNDVLDPYWPSRRTMPAKSIQGVTKSNSQVEHLLNFRHGMDVDSSKLKQTSATYCYTAPILTPGPSLSSNCSQKIRLIAETRKHLFTTQYLLYNDSSTGLNLSNIDYLNKNLDTPEYQDVFTNQDDFISSNYWDYMNKNIMTSSDSEGPVKKDVWFSNHFDNDPINYSL